MNPNFWEHLAGKRLPFNKTFAPKFKRAKQIGIKFGTVRQKESSSESLTSFASLP